MSPTSSPPSSVSPAKKSELGRQPPPETPPRPSAPEPPSPESSFPTSDASPNGHAPELNEEDVPQVPSQAPAQRRDIQSEKSRLEHGSRAREESDRDENGVLPGSDPEDEGDLGSGESDGDWAQDDMESDLRRVKVRINIYHP